MSKKTKPTTPTTPTATTTGGKLIKFRSRIQMYVWASLSSLGIARHLKIGLWREDESTYTDGEQCLTNLDVTSLEIGEQSQTEGEDWKEYLVDIGFTFDSDRSESDLKEQLVLYYGANSSSLESETGERELIETADYLGFEVFKEDD